MSPSGTEGESTKRMLAALVGAPDPQRSALEREE